MNDHDNSFRGHFIRSIPLFLISVLLVAAFGCSKNYWLLNKISTEYRDSFRKLKFLITKEERKAFLNLSTDEEREEFFINFWKKRDPDPETIENELRDEYMARISMAERLFSHEGKNGWETDRGRVYIKLGPPEFRESYPMGYSMYSLPSEVWYYGSFPIVFVDRNRSGSLDLTPLGARYIAQLLAGAKLLKPGVLKTKDLYDFNVRTEKISENNINIILLLKNKNIYFKSDPNYFYSDVEITLNFNLINSDKIFSVKRKKRIAIKKSGLEEPGKFSELIIPIHLKKGKYEFIIILDNPENNIKVQKRIRLKV
ncbi:MAG: GWxTD domain-containing protein [Acidobacteriota bacterium]